MKKMFFIIMCACALMCTALSAAGCADPERGWSLDEDREDAAAGGVGAASEADNAAAAPETESAGGGSGGGTGAGNADADREEASGEHIFVHVCGAVVSPGIYELPAGSRVADAVEAAGGMSGDAARDHANLAAVLEDGLKIVILTAEEAETDPYGLRGGDGEAFSAGAGGPEASGPVNINTADAERLQTLPGIGSVRAEAIIAYRRTHGDFASAEDIRNVSGIGAATWESIRDLITV